jgi:dTDP-4-amino-4,6-dideoxygalactose transaminase
MKKKIKLFEPVIDFTEKKAIVDVLESKFWASGSGTGLVSKFEQEFKKYTKSDTCVAVNSGTAALNLALSLFNIKNKEVILPSMSFVSTAHCIIENGGIPIFVDIKSDTLCIDPEKIKNAITKNTTAVIPVHFGGMSCDMDEILKISKKFNLDIIEDAAHAVGTKFKKKRIGTHGATVCFSFHPVKSLAMPAGGLISINHKKHEKFKELLFSRRWCGITNRKNTEYDVNELGWNYYMNEFSAAIGLQQLKKIERLNEKRKKIARKYYDEIDLESKMQFNDDCSYHLYWILIKKRQKFREKLEEKGIETGTHYKPIHSMKMYNNDISLPITELIGKQIVTIPIHANLQKLEIKKIIKHVNDFS